MRMKILAAIGVLLLSSSVILFYFSPDQSFTVRISVTVGPDARTQVAIKNVTCEVLNDIVPIEKRFHPFQSKQGALNESGYVVRLALDLQGLGLPYHVQRTSPDLVIESGDIMVHFFENAEPGEYLLRIQVYAGSHEIGAESLFIGEETLTILV